MGTSQKKEPNVSGTEKELTPDQTLGLVSLSLMQKLSQKDPSFSWLEEDKMEKVNLKNLRDRLELTQLAINLSLIHISEPTRRTPISYAVFCLKKKFLVCILISIEGISLTCF